MYAAMRLLLGRLTMFVAGGRSAGQTTLRLLVPYPASRSYSFLWMSERCPRFDPERSFSDLNAERSLSASVPAPSVG